MAYNDIQQIWYPANGYHRPKGVIMGAYILGEDGFDRDFALDLAKMAHSQRLEHALASGERIRPGYRDELEVNTGVSRAWSEGPFQKGSWPSAPVPIAALEVPDGAVYFAGDHTSALSGWHLPWRRRPTTGWQPDQEQRALSRTEAQPWHGRGPGCGFRDRICSSDTP